MNQLEIALHWCARGVPVVPMAFRSKRPLVRWSYERVTSEAQARHWFGNGRRLNLALVCGGEAGLLVLDFDSVSAFDRWAADVGELMQTHIVRTARGYHVYYFVLAGAPSAYVGGIDVRGDGKIVVAPPSVHPSAVPYAVANAIPPRLIMSVADVVPEVPPTLPLPRVAKFDVYAKVREIKRAVSILDLAASLTELRSSDGGRGEWFMGLCPFHDDRRPSFSLNVVWGWFRCKAPHCPAHRGGDVINLYALAHGLSNSEAIVQLWT